MTGGHDAQSLCLLRNTDATLDVDGITMAQPAPRPLGRQIHYEAWGPSSGFRPWTRLTRQTQVPWQLPGAPQIVEAREVAAFPDALTANP